MDTGSCMDVKVGLYKKPSTEELMLLNCGVGEDSWESLGLPRDQTSPSWRKKKFWIFIGKTDAEAETPIIRPLNAKNQLTGRAWCCERLKARGEWMIEGEMIGWHHWLNRHEFEQAPGVGAGQGSLACCSPWGCKELVMTATELNWTELGSFRFSERANSHPRNRKTRIKAGILVAATSQF